MNGELAGLTVLIPRGGGLGDRLAAAVSGHGGTPVIAPIIQFSEPQDARRIAEACERLTAGEFDWLAVTSATTVDVLVHHAVRVPDATRVAAVGPATRDALQAAGVTVEFIPESAFSAEAMVAQWPDARGRVLIVQSAIAEPTLADGLVARGLNVSVVSAYQTTTLDWDDEVTRRLNNGGFQAVLLTSASMARAVASRWLAPLNGEPRSGGTIVACIGASTAAAAQGVGLPVHVVAADSTAEALVTALCRGVAPSPHHNLAPETVQPPDLR